jgi:membrane protease YdiL (CAAX protease family)
MRLTDTGKLDVLGMRATIFGLLVALFGPPVVALIAPKIQAHTGFIFGSLIGLAGIIFIVTCVLTVIFRLEHQPLLSIGFRPLRWQSAVYGLALAGFFMYVFTPAASWVLAKLPFGGFETGLSKISSIPTWLLIITIVIVATAEEILYRGYAIERMAEITGSYWMSCVISVLVYGIAHIPNWGLGAALSTVVSGTILTAFFIWQQDLTANIIAHVVTDLMGLVVMPWIKPTIFT